MGIVPGRAGSEQVRIAAFVAVAIALGFWLLIVVRQVADGGFYSDDWAIQWEWHTYGFSEAVSRQFDILGAKPLLGILLIGSYEVLGTDPARHHLIAALLTLGCTIGFYFVIRGLRFPPYDAIPITLLALLFPWASSVRLWPTGSLNNFAVLLLFAGFLIALRGLRVEGQRGVLIHVAATACYVASILTYEVTTAVALFAWTGYAWLGGWRAALPRMALDVPAVAAAAIYTEQNTNKHVASLAEQLRHIPDIAREGGDLIAGTLLPVSIPAEISPALTAIVLGAALAVLVLAALRSRALASADGRRAGIRWPIVAAAALGALALCWAVYIPQAFYTPTFRGLEDRVNILALYPAAVLVWAVLRSAGSLGAKRLPMGRSRRDRRGDRLRDPGSLPAGQVAALHRAPAKSSVGGRAGASSRRRRGPRLRLPGRDRSRRPGAERQLRLVSGGAAGDLELDRDLSSVRGVEGALLAEGRRDRLAGDAPLRQDHAR